MERHGDEVHTSEVEASGGSKEGVVRWVLIFGLLLVAIAFAIIVMTGALSQPDGRDSETSVSNVVQQQAATEDARGEPIPPAMGEPSGDAAATAAPSTSATPGDAPAGDPKPDTQ